jgi:hypothetical protein
MARLDRIRIKDKCRAEHEFRFIVILGLEPTIARIPAPWPIFDPRGASTDAWVEPVQDGGGVNSILA